MEYGINRRYRQSVVYITFVLLLAFTNFEYFFREEYLFFALSLGALLYSIKRKYNSPISVYVCLITFFLCYLMQYFSIEGYKITSVISRSIYLWGAYFIARIIYKHFISIYLEVIYWLSIISLVIYLGCTFFPQIKFFLMEQIAPYFISLNVDSAIQKGGGINILIFNFQTKNLLDSVGLMRNSGPFWEPGMYAVFLSIGLFFNLFVSSSKRRYFNWWLGLSLLTTLSAGGYIAAAFIFMLYVLTRTSIWLKILGVAVFIVSLSFISELDFVGTKISNQVSSAEVGNDVSRFSAILTQFEMIKDSPIIGGASISDYVDTDEATLASGFFFVFIQYGVPIGIFFYIMFFKSLKRFIFSYHGSSKLAFLFIALFVLLSISQTIFSNAFFLVLLFVGLLRKTYKNGAV